MKVLIFHNLLWSQYKSVIFERLSKEIKDLDNADLLVIQTAITENSRKDLVDFDLENFPFNYQFKLISKDSLEKINHIKILFSKIYYIIKFKPNVINFTGYNEPSTIILLLLSKILHIKTIITNESIFKQSEQNKFLTKLKFTYKVILFKLTDGFFSYGIQSNNFLFRHKVPKSKILSFLNTFDKSKFISQDSTFKIDYQYMLFVGRLSAEKNLIELIKAFKSIQNSIKELKLVIIGNGPEKNKIELLLKELKLEYHVILLGTIKWNDLSEYYKFAHCLILPSLSETWGMVANEAQELNLPVICTINCGCADDLIINNYSGLVIDENINSDKNIQLIINFIKYNHKSSMYNFITKNRNVHALERLSSEMIDSMNRLRFHTI